MAFFNAVEIARLKAFEASATKVRHLDDTTEQTILFLKSLTKGTAPVFFGAYAQHRLRAMGARIGEGSGGGWYQCEPGRLIRIIESIEKRMIARVIKKLEEA